MNTLFTYTLYVCKIIYSTKDKERVLNSDDTVNVEFSKLPELDSEVGERNLKFVELGITMHKNLIK